MHYAFDLWVTRRFPGCPFERYTDDVIVHCDSERQARHLRAAIAERLGPLDLELHPEKTRVVYCKDRAAEEAMSTPASTTSVTPSGLAEHVAPGGCSAASYRP